MTKKTCFRGEVWLTDFNPGRGSEQTGIRPAVIVQNDIGNQYGATTIVAVITTTLKNYPVTVSLEAGEGGVDKPCMINLSQLLTIDKDRLGKKLGKLNEEKICQMNTSLKISLALVLD
jgi:mRNA interferase MazF